MDVDVTCVQEYLIKLDHLQHLVQCKDSSFAKQVYVAVTQKKIAIFHFPQMQVVRVALVTTHGEVDADAV